MHINLHVIHLRQSMHDAYPSLQHMYFADDGYAEVFCFKDATATFSALFIGLVVKFWTAKIKSTLKEIEEKIK